MKKKNITAAAGGKTSTIAEERLLQVVRRPQMSEKATRVADRYNQIIFEVDKAATKTEIKSAVELVFKVQVHSVTVLNVKGKVRRFRQEEGRTKGWKKAFVRLKAGQEINFVS